MSDATGIGATTQVASQSLLDGHDGSSSLGEEVLDAGQQMREESLKTAETLAEFDRKDGIDPTQRVENARDDLKPGPADAADKEGSDAEMAIESFEKLSQMTWRMVSFEAGNAAVQKSDKSVKMFIQSQ